MKRPWLLLGLVVSMAPACAPGADDPGAPVRIEVVDGDAPVAGAPVIVHGPAGEVRATDVTDATGAVTARLPDGGLVTVVRPWSPRTRVTVVGARAGDGPIVIPLGTRSPGEPVGTLRVDAPAEPPPAATRRYVVDTACGSFYPGTLPATIAIAARCVGDDGRVPVLVTAWTEAQNSESPGESLAFAAGVSSPASPGALDVTVTLDAWSTACAQLDVRGELANQVSVIPRLGGVGLARLSLGFCPPATPAPGATAAIPTLDLGGGAIVHAWGYVSGSLRTTALVSVEDELPAALDLDAAGPLVADLALTSLDSAGAAWADAPALAAADVVVADLTWLVDEVGVDWRFILPAGATAIDVPELPAEIATSADLDAATQRTAALHLIDASWLEDVDSTATALPAIPVAFDAPTAAAWLPAGAELRMYTERFYPGAD